MTATEQTEDNLQLLFPTVVQVSQIPNHQEMNESLLRAISDIRKTEKNSKPDSWACDLFTTIGSPQALLHHPALNQFLNIAKAKILQYAEAYKYRSNTESPRITECWLNAYSSGHSQEIHLHRNSMFSGIYYVQVPPGSGPTLFYSPLSDVMLEPGIQEGNNFNAKVSGFPAVEGRMLIFRSSLRHSVLPSEIASGERITVAFNAVM